MKKSLVKDYFVLYKNTGKFYNALGIDAYILNHFLGYKVLDNKKCGFPETAFEKVIQKLEENKISYQVIFTDKNPVVKNYKKLNKYQDIVKKVRAHIDLSERVEFIIQRVKDASIEEMEIIIERLEECFK